jgi:murein DD-endopeptidase MepM/ murein hydrolase activator NlpD
VKFLAPAIALLLAMALPAAALELQGTLTQGGLVIGKVTPGSKVSLDGAPVAADDVRGLFVIGFGRDHGPVATLQVEGPDGGRETIPLAIASREWSVSRIDGLTPRKVTPAPEDLERIKRDAALIRAARAQQSDRTDFLAGFIWPAKGRLSGHYGDQRILNGEPRAPHLGTDIAAPVGTPVHAAASGTVTLAERDLFYTGGTIAIDHGYGLSTIYSHLSQVAAAVGDTVAQGARIGAIGATGRASGPHLDWRLNWFQERLDPELLVGPMPGTSASEVSE